MAALLSPAEIADKQVRAATQHVQDFRDGVNKTTKNPMQRAKAAKQKMMDNFSQSMSDGSYEAGLDSVSMQDWQSVTATKGGDNYVKGVQASKPKIVAFQDQFTPFRRAVQAQVQSMPSTTFEDNIARMTANAVGLHNFKYKPRRVGA